MNSSFNPDNSSLRKLFLIGYFNISSIEIISQENTVTRSGRLSKPPDRFTIQHYPKGSGCCNLRGYDRTDMEFDGNNSK